MRSELLEHESLIANGVMFMKITQGTPEYQSLGRMLKTTRAWFDHGVLRELFTIEVDEGLNISPECLPHAHTENPREKLGLHVPRMKSTLGYRLEVCPGDKKGVNSEKSNTSGVESFVVRLPRENALFPWPVTLPSLEEDLTSAFHCLQSMGWAIFVSLVKSILKSNSQESLQERIVERILELKSTDERNKNNYTSSILFLRRYMSSEEVLVTDSDGGAHTDSGILTIIPFASPLEIKGLFTLRRGDKTLGDLDDWIDAHSAATNALSGESESDLNVLVLVGETGEAILRAFLPPTTLPAHSIASLHRVDASQWRQTDSHDACEENSPGEPLRRVTTPFQLRVAFEHVPGFITLGGLEGKAMEV